MASKDYSTNTGQYVAGVDEVGRGPLVGDVVAAAVILPAEYDLPGLRDSKKLSPKRREQLQLAILEQACAWSIGRATPAEIDRLNILQASLLAMQRAVDALSLTPDHVLVDGNRLPQWHYSSEAVVGGDDSHACIAAASVLAKVQRDAEMLALDAHYPQYGFAQHKGYPTKTHLAALQAHGPCEHHRRSFKPVQQLLLATGGE